MKVRFSKPSELAGTLRVPASKSYTHRAYLTALVAGGGIIRRPLTSEDTDATLACLDRFEARVEVEPESVRVASERPPRLATDRFDVGESGTLLRFLVPLCSVCPGPQRVSLEGRGTLTRRSNRNVVASMREAGFQIEATGEDATVPLTCFPGQSLPPGAVPVSGATTSQIVSGWLLALAAGEGGRLRLTDRLVSAPYVTMTARVLGEAGFSARREESTFTVDTAGARPLDFEVPGDYSSAAFFLVAAVIAGRDVVLRGLDPEDPQADRRILTVLESAGADVTWTDGSLRIQGPSRPGGFTLDALHCPDLVPVLAVLGSAATDTVVLHNLQHLSNKESDRIHATAGELRRAGVRVETEEQKLAVHPGEKETEPVTLHAHGDHRLAMALSVLGLRRGNLEVEGAGCVAKSYPNFFRDLEALGGHFETIEAS